MNINLLNITSWLIFGLLVGFVAHLMDPADVAGGVWGTLLTGVLGAIIGGFLSSNLFGVNVTGFNASSFIISVAGSLIFVALERTLFRNDDRYRKVGVKGGRRKRRW